MPIADISPDTHFTFKSVLYIYIYIITVHHDDIIYMIYIYIYIITVHHHDISIYISAIYLATHDYRFYSGHINQHFMVKRGLEFDDLVALRQHSLT